MRGFKQIGRFGQSKAKKIAGTDISKDLKDGERNYVHLEYLVKSLADYPERIVSIERLLEPVSFFELNYFE